MTHERHIYQTAAHMDMLTMCAYPPSQNTLPRDVCFVVLHIYHKLILQVKN